MGWLVLGSPEVMALFQMTIIFWVWVTEMGEGKAHWRQGEKGPRDEATRWVDI